ncbi:hypothetical protein LK542_16500 [Massilia sp. IC2-477]|uniref:hypothetical protein n=1 Tax=Massilia sp. IC2-477 TaxID=2887198 RepID=UPI001D128ED5|nr:hypothetical protein [Massilia sp. IC2-477]MCC2957218.1 hypothetical protein [Massilia sp. IC2-477]
MASLSLSPAASFPAERRLPGILVTVLVHAALILAWQLARTLPPLPARQEGPAMQWLRLPPLLLKHEQGPRPVEARRPSAPPPVRPNATRRMTPPTASGATAPTAAPQEAAPAPAPLPEATPAPSTATILENARRSVGSIDRALRKEAKPLIVAPPDSPELRMRQGMEQARALAPTRIWEAPKVEELVNNTGDGARRTRVITGRGTYCITERSPATNVEMIEMHGKIRLTNCPSPEEPAKRQEWRTARD